MRKTVTESLRMDSMPPQAAGTVDMGFVLKVMEAVERRRLLMRLIRLCAIGIGGTIMLGLAAPYLNEMVDPLAPAFPALVATICALFAAYVLRKQTGLFGKSLRLR